MGTDMALRIRKDGRVLCAAMHEAEPGDTYLDDGIHYQLSAERKLLVTEPMEKHKDRGQWWWAGNVPPEITIDDYYRAKRQAHPTAARRRRWSERKGIKWLISMNRKAGRQLRVQRLVR